MQRAIQDKSVIVCGGGIVGLCCAFYLAKDGFRVRILERGRKGHDSCAVGSAGFVSPSHFVPLVSRGSERSCGICRVTGPARVCSCRR